MHTFTMPNEPTALIVILVLIALISVARNIIEIIASFRRKPGIDKEFQDYMPRVEVDKNFAKQKSDHKGYCENRHHAIELSILELKEEDSKIWIKLNGMDRTNATNQADIQRALGRIEGELKTISKGIK